MSEDLIIVAGDEVDLNRLTQHYTTMPDVIEVHLPIGPGEVYKLTFKPLPNRAELDASLRHHGAFFKKQKKTDVHPWAPFWPQNAQEYVDAALIAELSIEPKIAVETALQWMRNPSMVRAIMEQIEVGSKTVATQWLVAMTEEKKSDSPPTHLDDPA